MINEYHNCPLPIVCLSDSEWQRRSYAKAKAESVEIEYWKQRAYSAENKLGRAINEMDESKDMAHDELVLWESAKTILVDFTRQLYESLNSENPFIKAHGTFCKGISLPWTKRGEYMNQFGVPSSIRKMILSIIMETTPQIFIYNGMIKAWQANVSEYVNQFEMVDAINQAFSRLVVAVGGANVGYTEEA